MRVMVFVKATEDSEKGFVRTAETDKLMEEMSKFNDELIKAGILKEGHCDALRLHLTPSVLLSMVKIVQLLMGLLPTHVS